MILNKIPFFLLSLVTGLAGIFILGHAGTLESGTFFTLFQRIFIGPYSLCVYLLKSVVPYQLSAIYPYPEKLSVLYYSSLLVVILLAWLVYKKGKARKELVFGALFFLFSVVFMLQVVVAGQGFTADRYTYIPYLGLFFLIAFAANSLYNSKWKPYLVVSGVIYLAGLGAITWNRTHVWKNTETLFSDVIRKYPGTVIAYNNLGLYYRNQNQDDKAIGAYSKAIELKPSGYLSYSNRGEVLFDRGETDKALEDMNMAIRL
jgi:tetratricopeptide (TPR) repeat protein